MALRADALGMFWEDMPEVREKKEVVKREPPDPVWLAPDYLPNLEEALTFAPPLMDDEYLREAARLKEEFVFDVECYPNYFLCAFKSIQTGKVLYFEKDETGTLSFDAGKFLWVLQNLTIIGFNSYAYDIPIITLAISGVDCAGLRRASGLLIDSALRGVEVLKLFKVKHIKEVDHIDLIEVAPLRASLKIYGGRLHTRRMQDLPFHPSANLTKEQIAVTRWYCVNDLDQTAELREKLDEQLSLRVQMSREYRTDLRSRSDAQIAERVISRSMHKLVGQWPRPPEIMPGTLYHYRVPHFIRYETPLMQWALGRVAGARFYVSEYGNVGMPQELKDLEIPLGDSVYRMGIGGLHSSEQKTAHFSDSDYLLVDRDVTSYYPAIILNLGLYPHHLGDDFLFVYRDLVNRRLDAKRRGDKVIADSLKITINGSFGKLGSMYSALYSPDLLIQVTITGQLSLLMLIEALELRGIPVVSANTDGLVIKCKRELEPVMNQVVQWWEAKTGFETEETPYRALYSRDVNNYIAITTDNEIKSKGAYAKAGLQKNPANQICIDAVKALLLDRTPIESTIYGNYDVTKFVSVRTVRGGAVKDGEFLGKSIRWYYSNEDQGEIVYATSGNLVPRTKGAKPLMLMDGTFPEDLDKDWYVNEAYKILGELAYA